jgi:hypothetical protein
MLLIIILALTAVLIDDFLLSCKASIACKVALIIFLIDVQSLSTDANVNI